MNDKELRIKQEYFFSSASIQNAFHEFSKRDLQMKGIEECCPEDLNEVVEIYQLVEDALGDDIIKEKDKKFSTIVTTQQAKAFAKILHNKINKKKYEEIIKVGN